MEGRGFDCCYDVPSSTLEISGTVTTVDWAGLCEELDRAFRRTACHLTLDLTRATGLPAHDVGRLVQLCNRSFPGTLVLPPVSPPAPTSAPAATAAVHTAA